MISKRNHTRSTSGSIRRITSALRTGSVQAIVALTTVSAFGLAADTVAAKDGSAHKIPGSATVAAIHHWLGTGKASWYGLKFQGHKTATGEKFNMNDLTCAHRSLPLGSWVRVTNLNNQKSVIVRVNDRGPVSEGRIVDLSYAAAHAVGMNGIARVKLETSPGPSPETTPLIAQLHMPPSLVTFPLPLQ